MSSAIFFSTGGVYTPAMLGMLAALNIKGTVKKIDAVGGISSGAMIASFLATRKDIDSVIHDVIHILIQNSGGKAISPHYSWLNNILSLFTQDSIFNDDKIDDILFRNLKDKSVLRDLYIGYTNETDMEYVPKKFMSGLVHGDLHKYVHASMSIPVVFKGVEDNGKKLSDGGLFHTLPTEQIRQYVYDCMEKKIFDAEIHLISASAYKFTPPKIADSGFAKPIRETIRLTKSLHNITMHNDKLWLDLFKENCLLRGFNLIVHDHLFPAELMQIIDEKIPFERYNSIGSEDVLKLFNLGKDIIQKPNHIILNF
tara:strand:- start:4290 stop:5225 length:936 start_codon:yes stop_codon:yes gene_type:complete